MELELDRAKVALECHEGRTQLLGEPVAIARGETRLHLRHLGDQDAERLGQADLLADLRLGHRRILTQLGLLRRAAHGLEIVQAHQRERGDGQDDRRADDEEDIGPQPDLLEYLDASLMRMLAPDVGPPRR